MVVKIKLKALDKFSTTESHPQPVLFPGRGYPCTPMEGAMCISTIGGIPAAVERVPFTFKREWSYCERSIFLAVTEQTKVKEGEGTRSKRQLSGRACLFVLVTIAILV